MFSKKLTDLKNNQKHASPAAIKVIVIIVSTEFVFLVKNVFAKANNVILAMFINDFCHFHAICYSMLLTFTITIINRHKADRNEMTMMINFSNGFNSFFVDMIYFISHDYKPVCYILFLKERIVSL